MVAESPEASRCKQGFALLLHDSLREALVLSGSTGHVSLSRHCPALSCLHALLHRLYYVLVDMRSKIDGLTHASCNDILHRILPVRVLPVYLWYK